MFTATVVFPTPPFPLAIAIRFFTPGICWRSGVCPGIWPGGIYSFPFLFVLICTLRPSLPLFPLRPLLPCFFFRHSRRGTSCTSSPIRMGRAHCVPPSRPRAPVSALRPGLRPSDTEDLSADVLAGAPAPAQSRANAASAVHSPALPRSQLLRQPHPPAHAPVPASVLSPAAAARSAGSARGTDTAPSRC